MEPARPGGALGPGEARRALAYGAALFVLTRTVLTLLGLLSRVVLESEFGSFYTPDWRYSSAAWLDLWGLWDSGWYLAVVREGYPTGVTLDPTAAEHLRIGFFPLYPLLTWLVSWVGIPEYESALLVANGALAGSCALVYRLVRLDAGEATAQRSLKYLLLFPSGFVLSSALAEPLLLMLSLLTFLLVRTERLPAAGCAGFALALTKPAGIFFLLPIAFELWLQRRRRVDASYLWLLLMPAGLATFALFCHWAVGDVFAYSHVKMAHWGIEASNPVSALLDGIRSERVRLPYYAGMAIVLLLVLIAAPRPALRLSYRLAALIVLLATLSAGWVTLPSVARYTAALFPFAILLGNLTRREDADQALTMLLLLMQGGLMILWSNGLFIV